MLYLKNDEEIELIKVSAQVLGKTHGELSKIIKPGLKTIDLDKIAEEFINDHGGTPSFKGYNGFPYTLCISVNEQVVHGFPGEYEIKEGDLLSIDCGVFLNGFHSDSAYTYAVGDIDDEKKNLLKTTIESLYLGIEHAVVGSRMGDVSHAIQEHNERQGFTVVRELVGHGVGKKLHEKPEVPNYGKRGRGPKLQEGMVLAIEPMINMGKRNIVQESDGWTIRTADRKPSAHFEHTVAVKKNKAEILTTFEFIKNKFKYN